MDKLRVLEEFIRSSKSALVALSGGIDSTLLSYLTHRILKISAISVTVISEFLITDEKKGIENFINRYALQHHFLIISLLSDATIQSNPPDRCYYCKRALFKLVLEYAHARDISSVFDGTNIDDLSQDRPGLRALKELGILSPYVEAGMGKNDILKTAAAVGLEKYIRPSNTCLATRMSLHTPITARKLNMIERAETLLHNAGFEVVRVRYHDPDTATIEAQKEKLKRLFDPALQDKIVRRFQEIGFIRVSVDMEGYK